MTVVKFEHIPIQESNEELVDLSTYNFVLEPSYFKQGLSSTEKMFLRKSVANKLSNIQNSLKGYRFKIWDGYRPRELQNTIYEKYWNELKIKHPDWSDEKLEAEVTKFIAFPNDPTRIPPHTTGGTIDLTLVDSSGKELDMGTGFDYFGPEAAPFYFDENDINKEAKQNRKLLRTAMIDAGFHNNENEWWHFDYGNQIWAAHYHKPFAIYGEVIK